MQEFAVARIPALRFGAGRIAELGSMLAETGSRRVLVVFSRSALLEPETRSGFLRMFESAGIVAGFVRYDRLPDDGDAFDAPRGPYREASPEVVDAIVATLDEPPEAIVAIGGGSALDTGKAVSVACLEPGSIVDYLEGVGTRRPTGRRLPLVAIPTTAGTGSESTKNAVLSRVAPDGFKSSLRHDAYVPDSVLIDPLLQLGCPRSLTAASGLDAITQLLEAFVSTSATPFTDALAIEGLTAAGRSYLRAVDRGGSDVEARAGMAWAAYLSGICLANAGLGTVHGLAGPAGAHTSVPHGHFCGLLLPRVTAATVRAFSRRRDGLGVLGRYAAAGRALTGRTSGSLEDQVRMLVDRLAEFVRVAGLTGLASFGFDEATIRLVARAGGNKNNPYPFPLDERIDLLTGAL